MFPFLPYTYTYTYKYTSLSLSLSLCGAYWMTDPGLVKIEEIITIPSIGQSIGGLDFQGHWHWWEWGPHCPTTRTASMTTSASPFFCGFCNLVRPSIISERVRHDYDIVWSLLQKHHLGCQAVQYYCGGIRLHKHGRQQYLLFHQECLHPLWSCHSDQLTQQASCCAFCSCWCCHPCDTIGPQRYPFGLCDQQECQSSKECLHYCLGDSCYSNLKIPNKLWLGIVVFDINRNNDKDYEETKGVHSVWPF